MIREGGSFAMEDSYNKRCCVTLSSAKWYCVTLSSAKWYCVTLMGLRDKKLRGLTGKIHPLVIRGGLQFKALRSTLVKSLASEHPPE